MDQFPKKLLAKLTEREDKNALRKLPGPNGLVDFSSIDYFKHMEDIFYTIGSFDYSADVQIIKGKLESEGIPVFLRDENTVNSDPLISYAIGGVKLEVYSKHKEKALKIYNEIRAYAVDTNGNPIVCPNCKAKRSEAYYGRKGIFLKLFPFFEQRKYRCTKCGIITKSN